MRAALAAIGSAFAYFSILPNGGSIEAPTPATMNALPLVGIVIGAISGAVGFAIAHFSTPLIGYAATFIFVILLSGAIHLDGFLDSCDALFASVAPQRRLEILKDPRHGTYAVVGMSILAVAWIAALSCFTPQRLPLVLAFAALLARTAAIFPAFFYGYARATPSFALGGTPSKLAFAWWLVVTIAGSFAIGHWAWLAIPIVLCVCFLAARWMARRLGGGLVGDSFGFLIAAAEPLVLFLLDIRV